MWVFTQKGYKTKEINDVSSISYFLFARGVDYRRGERIEDIAARLNPGDEVFFNFGLKISRL